jgi:hypothetical protein
MYPCKWNHASSEKNVNCRSISPSTTDCRNHRQKRTLLAGSRGCKSCVDYCCFVGSKLQQFCCRSCTRLWHSSDFLGVCSSLAPTSSNFSSVSTRSLCFCFLSVKSPDILNLCKKTVTYCLPGTLSSRNLCRNFGRHFLADSYFTYVPYRNTFCTMTYHTAH